jgi:hypothetical protein
MAGVLALPARRAGGIRLAASPETLRRFFLGAMVLSGSVTMFEPGPYELVGALTILVFLFGGLTLRREMVPILLLVVLYMTGALLSLILVLHRPDTLMWTLTGWFLAFTGLFFMMVLQEDTEERLRLIVNAYIATATICALLGVLGYAGALPSSDSYVRYGRVKSTFEDPNVFGPFLVLPCVILVQRLFIDGLWGALPRAIALLILLAGLFLSFSRGAWGHLVVSLALMAGATFLCARSRLMKARIAALSVAGVVLLALLVVALLSFDAVDRLFTERASLEQSYDLGEFGRFNRHWLGFVLALSKPFGIGMLQFGPMFGEDTHNTYLNAFMSYGWLGGIAWPTIVLVTLVVGWWQCLRPSPWRLVSISVVATYTAVIGEAWIIDIDHWRHVWLLFGVIWGLAIVTARLHRADSPASL